MDSCRRDPCSDSPSTDGRRYHCPETTGLRGPIGRLGPTREPPAVPCTVNLPNQLTLGRFVLTLLFLGVVFLPFPGHETVALVLFSVAGITDYLDGRIARERNLITRFGTLMDPLADKILTCSAFIAFVGQGLVPAWIAVIIVARELAITGLRLLAASNQVVLAAERYGKHKTISQIVTIILLLVWMAAPDGDGSGTSCWASRSAADPSFRWRWWVPNTSRCSSPSTAARSTSGGTGPST